MMTQSERSLAITWTLGLSVSRNQPFRVSFCDKQNASRNEENLRAESKCTNGQKYFNFLCR